MVVKVKGIKAARIAATIMQRHTGLLTEIHRGEDTGAIYWVSNTYLLPPGEQEVLDNIPTHRLLYCAGCSHQMPKREPLPPREGPGLSERTKENLRRIACDIAVSQRD